jgi:putative Mg2+ transporter-C (MgtC) family protein
MGDFLRDLGLLVLHLGLAYALAFPVGLERGKAARKTGFRTFPLVALGSSAFVTLARGIYGASLEAEARVLQGLLAGIGFIGAGVILKGEGHVRGLATAASLWNTCAIGAAVAYDRFDIAVLLAAANLATLHWIHGPTRREEREEEDDDRAR